MNNILIALVGVGILFGASVWLTHTESVGAWKTPSAVPQSVVQEFN